MKIFCTIKEQDGLKNTRIDVLVILVKFQITISIKILSIFLIIGQIILFLKIGCQLIKNILCILLFTKVYWILEEINIKKKFQKYFILFGLGKNNYQLFIKIILNHGLKTILIIYFVSGMMKIFLNWFFKIHMIMLCAMQ